MARCQRYMYGAFHGVVALMAFLAIAVPRSTILTDLLAAVFLSTAIYHFVALTVFHHGGTSSLLSIFKGQTISFCVPPLGCCLCCLKEIQFTKRTLQTLRILVLQNVIIRPILVLIAAVLWTDGKYTPGELSPKTPTLYIMAMNAVSTLFAMYGLVVGFRMSKVRLERERLMLKYAVLKLAIMFVNLQHIVFSVLSLYNIPKCQGERGSKVQGSSKSLLQYAECNFILGHSFPLTSSFKPNPS
ncbi:hypothetical protein ScPMuIL_009556 [Solemya velum]